MKLNMPRIFQIDVTVDHGQLYETLHSEEDRQLMISRLDAILSDTSSEKKDLREGVIQVLIDQLKNNNGHEPIILSVSRGDEIVWHCDHADVKVDVDKFRHTKRTPQQSALASNPFKFPNGNKSKNVQSGVHKDPAHSKQQKFYKFKLEGEDFLGNKITLDPCIICEP